MGGYQEKECGNCRFFDTDVYADPCNSCTADTETPWFSKWKSKRGAKAGVKRKKGAGPPKKPLSEHMCFPTIPIRSKHLEAYGGIEKLKSDVISMVKNKLNKLD